MPEPSADHAGDRLAMTEEIKSNYRSWTASLLWISRTVPEIKFAVGQLCRHMQNPSVDHINDVKKVARYLVGNLDRGLTFTGNRLDVNAQSDSDWGACKHTRRSCTGYVVFIGESLVIAKSQMQKLVALSSMEAELIALNECTIGRSWENWVLCRLRNQSFWLTIRVASKCQSPRWQSTETDTFHCDTSTSKTC